MLSRSYLINGDAASEEDAAMDLTEEQWARVGSLIGEPPRRADGRGRPWRESRAVLDGVLWVLRTGAPWKDLPPRYPPYQTCPRRFQAWVRAGTLERVLHALAEDLRERGGLDLSECVIDGTFIAANKGGQPSARPSGARVRSSWQWQTALVVLSPPGPAARRLTRSPSSSPSAPPASFAPCPPA
jgi:transposase